MPGDDDADFHSHRHRHCRRMSGELAGGAVVVAARTRTEYAVGQCEKLVARPGEPTRVKQKDMRVSPERAAFLP